VIKGELPAIYTYLDCIVLGDLVLPQADRVSGQLDTEDKLNQLDRVERSGFMHVDEVDKLDRLDKLDTVDKLNKV
jgi:hypothetical protein